MTLVEMCYISEQFFFQDLLCILYNSEITGKTLMGGKRMILAGRKYLWKGGKMWVKYVTVHLYTEYRQNFVKILWFIQKFCYYNLQRKLTPRFTNSSILRLFALKGGKLYWKLNIFKRQCKTDISLKVATHFVYI